jgi:hypothetical protein
MQVCIAGMHRSGTSMVTKYLHDCGLYLGPEGDLMPPAPENPEGFWENLNFVDLNEEILNQLGGGWDCPPHEPADWTTGSLAPLVAKAATIIEPFAEREPWGWKDPRSSLTLPFWQTLLDHLRVVVVVRNPLEVALSLRQRNGFSFALGLTLWHITNQRMLDATTPDDRIVTHYDAYFGDPEPEVRRLLTFLDMPIDEEIVAEIGSSVASGLRHHRLTIQDLIDANVSREVFELYRDLCDQAEWRDTDAARPASRSAPAVTATLPEAIVAHGRSEPAPLESSVGHISRSMMELRVLRRDLDEHKRSLAGREERIAELELAVRAHEIERQGRDETIDRLELTLNRERQEHDAAVNRERQEHDRVLDHERHEHGAAVQELLDVGQEATLLQQTVSDQAEHLRIVDVQLKTLANHESELRTLLVSAHEQLVHRDAEIIGTVGAALLPHAPNAPAAIYYGQLLDKIRAIVADQLPPATPLLIVSEGDEAMLRFDGRPAWHFPQTSSDAAIEYSPVDGSSAIAQLESARRQGAGFLIVPSTGQAWLARHPDLEAYLRQRFPTVVRREDTVVIYDLAEPTGGAP